MFDLLWAATAIGALMPLLAIIGFLIRIDSPGPALYLAERVGKRGRRFTMYKFRSMFHNMSGAGRSYLGDLRVTRIGRILRRTKLDELPQLINVFKGDMSLVGPRPESPNFVAQFPAEQRTVLEVAPGITGLAQIEFRDESDVPPTSVVDELESEYSADILPTKLGLDMYYVRRQSLSLDFRILVRTLQVVLSRQGEA